MSVARLWWGLFLIGWPAMAEMGSSSLDNIISTTLIEENAKSTEGWKEYHEQLLRNAHFPRNLAEVAQLDAACLESPAAFHYWIFRTEQHPYAKGTWKDLKIPRRNVLGWCHDNARAIHNDKDRLTQKNTTGSATELIQASAY